LKTYSTRIEPAMTKPSDMAKPDRLGSMALRAAYAVMMRRSGRPFARPIRT
jgi:hypothetical protein